MPFRSRQRYLHPVNSEKHEVTWSKLADASASQDITIVKGVHDVSTGTAVEVRVGAKVGFIFIEFNVGNDAGTDMVFHWSIYKKPFGTTHTNSSTYNQIDKRFIFKRGMEMLPASSADSFQVKRVFGVAIPPKFSRIGDSDEIVIDIQKSSATATNFCGFAIFKEIY